MNWHQPPGGQPPGYPPQGYPQQGGYPQQQPQPGYPQQGYPQPPAGFQNPGGDNPFAGMTSGDQTVGARNPYLALGNYILDIVSTKMVGRNAKKMILIEVDVVESDVAELRPGQRCSAFIHLSNADMRGRNIAQFVASVFGVEPVQLPKDSTHAPWNDPTTGRPKSWGEYASDMITVNPFAGRRVGCRVVPWTTQNEEEITLNNWCPAQSMVVPKVMQPPRMPQGPAPGAAPGPMPPGAAGWGPQPGGFAPPPQGPPPGGYGPPPGAMPQGAPPGPPGPPPGYGPPGALPPGQPMPGFAQPPGNPWGAPPPQPMPQAQPQGAPWAPPGPPQQGFGQPPGGWPQGGQQR